MRIQRWIELLCVLLLVSGCASTDRQPEPVSTTRPIGEQARPLDPAAQAAFDAALSQLKAGRFDDAIKGFQALTVSHPHYRGPWINWGIALGKKNSDKEAMALFQGIVSQHPDWATAHHELAILQRKAGQFGKSRQSYEAAIAAKPDFALAYRNLGLLCDLYLHDINCALSKYEKYQTLLGSEDKEVALWIADAKRRLSKEKR